jgi:hypothetical protein
MALVSDALKTIINDNSSIAKNNSCENSTQAKRTVVLIILSWVLRMASIVDFSTARTVSNLRTLKPFISLS